MRILKNKVKSNFVIFKSNDTHIGCGFIFESNNDTYCVTAGHVVFGRKYDRERVIEIFNSDGNKIDKFELISFIDFARKYDLALFKLYSVVDNLAPVTLCDSVTNNKLLSMSYMKPASMADSFFLDKVKFNDELDGNQFRYSAGQNAFNNYQDDTYGAEAMEGISGSPMLLCSWDNTVVLHGITSRIPNSGVLGFIETRSLNPLKEIVREIDIVDRTEYDSNHKLIRFNRKIIDDERFNEWIETWKSRPENCNYYENLESKLEIIHGESYITELPKELEKIMIGDECVKNIIEKNSTLFDSYEDVIETAEREKMEKYVSSQHEALEHYNKVYEEHLEVINEDLETFDLSRTDRKKIAQYNVATWMAVCNLRFSKK
ncbi:hypothetical protein [Vibrio anguillarum]|uniref:hypothetical protein n=1 Tax=Vibrio anguillarum TaxID=55601 RepID=UPI001A274715|nr:hypothetical protein [Vibrio anguillarum]EJA3092021.1 hypothetical protein [Vibrio parahaemolyticus]UJQ40084.1 hypothetical protein L2O48_11110 [Vibrio anguillarum]HAS8630981.1 hypothetical protein [Vibrio vulnificus]